MSDKLWKIIDDPKGLYIQKRGGILHRVGIKYSALELVNELNTLSEQVEALTAENKRLKQDNYGLETKATVNLLNKQKDATIAELVDMIKDLELFKPGDLGIVMGYDPEIDKGHLESRDITKAELEKYQALIASYEESKEKK